MKTRYGITKFINQFVPVLGIVLLSFYHVCDTSCSYLRGTLFGVDLVIVGMLLMGALLVLSIPAAARYGVPVRHGRAMLLAGALGGEILLVRFQIVHETYCPFCIAFGALVLILFACNFKIMNRYLAAASFVAGVVVFHFFFAGSVIPLFF